ncbi:hypothetical protein ACTA71_005264 [Dictyostelium dimigraforme]
MFGKENKSSFLIKINDNCFFEKIKGFPQFEIIENLIKIGQYEIFTDNIDSPNVIVSISLISNFIKFFTLENDNLNFEIVKNVIKSINWNKGCFISLNGIEKDELIKKTNYKDAILNHHFSSEVDTFYFGDIKNPILVKFIEEYFKGCGFKFYTFPFYNHYIIDIKDINYKNTIINQLNSIISNDENIVPLSKSDVFYINKNYRYRTEFTINELLWSVENGLAFGYKINNNIENKKNEINNNLICWNYIKSDGKSANLYTKPEFRCKGFGLKVKAKLTLSSIEKNIIPLSSAAYGNINSNSLFQKLGFKYSYSVTTMVLSKNKINLVF